MLKKSFPCCLESNLQQNCSGIFRMKNARRTCLLVSNTEASLPKVSCPSCLSLAWHMHNLGRGLLHCRTCRSDVYPAGQWGSKVASQCILWWQGSSEDKAVSMRLGCRMVERKLIPWCFAMPVQGQWTLSALRTSDAWLSLWETHDVSGRCSAGFWRDKMNVQCADKNETREALSLCCM